MKVKIKSKNSDVIWSKLIRLSPISALTALYNCNLGQIRSSKLKMDQLNTLIKETLIISKNDNYRDSYTNVKNLIKSLPDKLNTSLQRDINSGVSSELETQIGSIVKLSKKLNISSPMNEKIYLLLKKMSKKILAVIGLRSGSKGLKNKNIKKLNGKPLFSYILNSAKKSKYINRIIISTDSTKYEKIVKNLELKFHF